jgi:hypothetical protein
LNIKEVLAPGREFRHLTGRALVTMAVPGFWGHEFFEVVTHDSDGRLESIASLASIGVDRGLPGHGARN